MLILDANVLVSAILGRSDVLIREVADRGMELTATHAAIEESSRVLVRLGKSPPVASQDLINLARFVRQLAPDVYTPHEQSARARLHPRAQPDWPTLAAARALETGIWSNDREFFGTGVAVWSTRNVGHANTP